LISFADRRPFSSTGNLPEENLGHMSASRQKPEMVDVEA
jgi:hypothetical protein